MSRSRTSGPRRARLRKAVLLTVGALMAGAIAQELSKPKDERTWNGRVCGVPYDFRFPTADRVEQSWWAPDDPRLLTPKTFGLGWDVNLGRIVHLLRNPPAAG